jgi:hypothetical protein
MMRMLLLTVFLLLASSAAQAADNDFHCPAPGTKIDTSAGAHLVADTATGFDCHMTNGAEAFTMHAGFANLTNPVESREAAEKLWPLQVGKEAEYTTACENARCVVGTRYHNKLKVAGLEGVTVPAGTYRAYKITIDTISFFEDDKMINRGDSYHARSTMWWAPAVGYTIKYEWKFLSGFTYSSDRHWEATNIVSGSVAAK